MFHRFDKTVSIAHVFAVVVAERLFIEIAEQVKRLNAHVGSRDAALEQTPEVLKTVCVNPTIHILFRMIYNLMREVSPQTVIGKQGIGIQGALSGDMGFN